MNKPPLTPGFLFVLATWLVAGVQPVRARQEFDLFGTTLPPEIGAMVRGLTKPPVPVVRSMAETVVPLLPPPAPAPSY